MYVYMKYYSAVKVALIYPGSETSFRCGKYFVEGTKDVGIEECSVNCLNVNKEIKKWQKEISQSLEQWTNQ